MGRVMLLVLRASASYEVIEDLHLRGHILHLGIDNADGLFVNG